MESQCYQIDVLCFLNPHLIWAKVKNSSSNQEKGLEQIGLYGFMPLIPSVDEYYNLNSKNNVLWTPAAVKIMEKVLKTAAQVWFCPCLEEKRSSIFDDNIHKFGEIFIKKSDGKLKKLSRYLTNSKVAIENERMFIEAYATDNIQTKLDYAETKLFIQQIEKHYENNKDLMECIKNKTIFAHDSQGTLSALTVENLERHNRENVYDPKEKINKIFETNFEDSNLSERSCRVLTKSSKSPLSNYNSSLLQNIKSYNIDKTIRTEDKHSLINFELSKTSNKENVSNINFSVNVAAMERSTTLENKKSQQEEHQISPKFNKFKVTSKADNNLLTPCTSRKANHKETLVTIGPEGMNINQLVIKSVSRQKGYFSTNNAGRQSDFEVKNKKFTAYINSKMEGNIHVGNTSDFTFSKGTKINYDNSFTEIDVLMNDCNESDMNSVSKQNVTLQDSVYNAGSLKSSGSPLRELLKLHKNYNNMDKVDNKSAKEDQSHLNCIDLHTTVDGLLNVRNCNIEHVADIEKSQVLNKCAENIDVNAIKSNNSFLNKIHNQGNQTVLKECTNNHEIFCVSDCENIGDVIDTVVKKYSDELPEVQVKKTNDSVLPQNSKANHVNPFRNIDPTYSVFVEKLITPVLMVHTKNDNRIEPRFEVNDVCFNSHIQMMLRNIGVHNPMVLQTISWFSILRGFSFFMISPPGSGKTMGYVPAVCRLVADGVSERDSVGPISIILCATSKSVTFVENLCKTFLGSKKRVLACYAGFDELQTITLLLNGCDIFVCTPPSLIRLLQMTEFSVDLRRLSTVVFDDCERLAVVYSDELRIFVSNIEDMLKKRAFKEWKVQYILSSRVWCDFMTPFAKKAPNTVICISAFQECVLYCKAKTQVSFVSNENKIRMVLDFLKSVDNSKRTVIVCRNDNEVTVLEEVLSENKYFVYACNSSMTIEDLYRLNMAWNDYSEPLTGPILVCCDGNLTHMNVTNAHNLLHYSLPHLFSLFCKRFSVLNDNYASIFKADNDKVEIKILMDENNIEQLPKILNFIKRCTNEVPEVLNDISKETLMNKDRTKVKVFVPICGNLLTMGDCPDFWNCRERHTVFKEYDEPKESVPKEGVITFKVLHYHSAVLYSAKLLTHTVLGVTKKYPQTYASLSIKMRMYFSQEQNRRIYGNPKIGDICAVSVKQDVFSRCQVVKIFDSNPNGNANNILIKLIDEERLFVTKDIYLYYLPQEFIDIDTYVIQVRLANVIPKDHDITFSKLANDQLKKITEKEETLYLRGKVIMAVGNCVFVDSLEACQDLSNLKETVVMYNLKRELAPHVIFNSGHIRKVIKLCKDLDAYNKIEEKFKTESCLQAVQDEETINENNENEYEFLKDKDIENSLVAEKQKLSNGR